MNATKIEWVKNPDGTQGYTWNPITGCLNGCEYCYAKKLANGRLRERYLANKNMAPPEIINDVVVRSLPATALINPFYPRFWAERLGDIPLKPPRGIFVCDMGELFGDWLPRDWQDRVFNIIKGNPQHRFYLLTKQPQNPIKFSPFPDNCWVGVTATNEKMFIKAIDALWGIDATVRYISFEPLLGRILMNWRELVRKRIKWVIIGAQTKPTVMPKIEWVEEIVRACDKAGVPVFLKDNLKPLLTKYRNYGVFFQDETRLRQEMPK